MITRLLALPTRPPSTIVPRFRGAALAEAMLSLDNTTASELPAGEMGWAAGPYLVGVRICRSWSGASGRGASVIANPLQRFGHWLQPAALSRSASTSCNAVGGSPRPAEHPHRARRGDETAAPRIPAGVGSAPVAPLSTCR